MGNKNLFHRAGRGFHNTEKEIISSSSELSPATKQQVPRRSLTRYIPLGCAVLAIAYFTLTFYVIVVDPYVATIFMSQEKRFLYAVNVLGTGDSCEDVDRLLPENRYKRLTFQRSTGGFVWVIFKDPVNEKLRNGILNVPKTIESFEELKPLEEGFIISIAEDSDGRKGIDGYKWKDTKVGGVLVDYPRDSEDNAE